ncbi:MAG: sigma factor [Planctomycetota bacterium]
MRSRKLVSALVRRLVRDGHHLDDVLQDVWLGVMTGIQIIDADHLVGWLRRPLALREFVRLRPIEAGLSR